MFKDGNYVLLFKNYKMFFFVWILFNNEFLKRNFGNKVFNVVERNCDVQNFLHRHKFLFSFKILQIILYFIHQMKNVHPYAIR